MFGLGFDEEIALNFKKCFDVCIFNALIFNVAFFYMVYLLKLQFCLCLCLIFKMDKIYGKSWENR
jgi:hypothetical protein